MTQITLYLDEETETLVTQAAKARGLSKSRWVAGGHPPLRARHLARRMSCLGRRFPRFSYAPNLARPG